MISSTHGMNTNQSTTKIQNMHAPDLLAPRKCAKAAKKRRRPPPLPPPCILPAQSFALPASMPVCLCLQMRKCPSVQVCGFASPLSYVIWMRTCAHANIQTCNDACPIEGYTVTYAGITVLVTLITFLHYFERCVNRSSCGNVR